MALDVHLRRIGESTWEFKLVGKPNFKISVSEEHVPKKVHNEIVRIPEYSSASSITSSSSASTIEEVEPTTQDSGLYDPVLDDTEVIYETIGPADSDQQSNQLEQPTEVQFNVPEFTNKPDFARSLTSSPYLNPTKPYRPFSTEPLQVPPVEDPIILNPNYRDNWKDVFPLLDIDSLPTETKFKLPISEQYDPNYLKKKKEIENKQDSTENKQIDEDKNVIYKESENILKVQEITQESVFKQEKTTKEEFEYLENMKKEIDINKIEETATTLVDESIETAISVAQEINKEINVELCTVTESHDSEIKIENKEMSRIHESTITGEIATSKTKTMDAESTISSFSDQTDKKLEKVAMQKEEITQDDSKTSQKTLETEKLEIKEKTINSTESVEVKSTTFEKNKENLVKGSHKTGDETKENQSLTGSSAEKRAYVIGLQTIPNIRGVVKTTDAYNLLLKTFFVHLTDVMVALSRFMLVEPTSSVHKQGSSQTSTTIKKQDDSKITSYVNKKEENIDEMKNSQHENVENEIKIENVQLQDESKFEKTLFASNERQIFEQDINLSSSQNKTSNEYELFDDSQVLSNLEMDNEEFIYKQKLSGAEIAQIEGHKPAELTDKMDKVIMEFENKSGISELTVAESRNRRSRSRSRQNERISPAVVSLELDNKQMAGLQTTAENIYSQSEITKVQSQVDVLDNSVQKDKDGNVTYVAIVESHVYTNKQAIFEEQMRRMSDISTISENKNLSVKESSIKTVEQQFKQPENFESQKLITKESQVLIEKPVKSVAEITEVTVDEAKTEKIKTPEVTLEQPKFAVSEAVAKEVIEISAMEPKQESFEMPKIPQRQAHINVEEFKVVETIVTTSEESIQKELEIPEIICKQPQVAIEEPIKRIAEATVVSLAEAEDILEANQMISKATKVQIESPAHVAEKSEVVLETMTKELEKLHTAAENKVRVVVEKSLSDKAEVHEANVQEARVEIECKIELPPPIKKTCEEESASLKIVKEQIIEVTPPEEVYEDFDFNINKVGIETSVSKSASGRDVYQQNVSEVSQLSMQSLKSTAVGSTSADFQSIESKLEKDVKVSVLSQEQSLRIAETQESSESYVQNREGQVEYQKSFEAGLQSQQKTEEQKLLILTDLATSSEKDENNNTPSPTSVPPTPLIDEYVFKLEARLPKSRNTSPVPRDCSLSPEHPQIHEDPNIVKKKLIPHIDLKIEQKIFDPPLPTPPTSPESKDKPGYVKPGLNGGSVDSIKQISSKKLLPRYIKPGLYGGSDEPFLIFSTHKKKRPVYIKPVLRGGSDEITKEEMMEIERTSSLLTSAIDETIKSIQEYKESVGIDINQERRVKEIQSEFVSSETTIEELIQNGETEDGDVRNGELQNGHVEEINGKSEETQHETTIEELRDTSEETNNVILKAVTETFVNGNDSETKTVINEAIDQDSSKEFENIKETTAFSKEIKITDKSKEMSTFEKIENQTDCDIVNDSLNKPCEELPTKQILEETQVAVVETRQEQRRTVETETKTDPLQGYRPVQFDPEAFKHKKQPEVHMTGDQVFTDGKQTPIYTTDLGEIIGTQQGFIDGLEEAVVDPEVEKLLGKPGLPDEKIAELISGEAEMLREAHVMGLARVLSSHMHRPDDSSVDFKKIKPCIDTLKDSEVLKALNDEILKNAEAKKGEERRWTTFLQKPSRPMPKHRVVFCGDREYAKDCDFEEEYRVKIVKQPKPKVAPDYKPEDFDTGPLPWEQRAEIEQIEAASAPPVEPEEPILIPEETPEILVAVDPLPENEVPDLEDTGIPLPPPELLAEYKTEEKEEETKLEPEFVELEQFEEEVREEQITEEEMEKNVAEQLMKNIENMVDPNATLEQQLAQMREQLATLAQLPTVIQQTLELVTRQISTMQQTTQVQTKQVEQQEQQEEFQESYENIQEEQTGEQIQHEIEREQTETEKPSEIKPSQSEEELARIKKEEEERIIEEQQKLEKQKKELIEQMRIEQESRQVKQRSAPRVGKPRPMFGPPVPQVRPVVLPGGRKWRKPDDAYNEQMISETLAAQAEVIKGKAIGVNFMKYEKPPVSLDHLQKSEVYKIVHNMDETPLKRVEMLTPVVAEADYREQRKNSRFSPVSRVVIEYPDEINTDSAP